MKEDTREFFKIELEHFEKASEIQFNHFMGVFYFWVGVVSIPATAGLLTAENINPKYLAYLSLIIAVLGHFLSAKMFDIRCSQLNYLTIINEFRHYLYKLEKNNLSSNYKHPYPYDTNLRRVAFRDFGFYMAIIMSSIDALFFGVGIY